MGIEEEKKTTTINPVIANVNTAQPQRNSKNGKKNQNRKNNPEQQRKNQELKSTPKARLEDDPDYDDALFQNNDKIMNVKPVYYERGYHYVMVEHLIGKATAPTPPNKYERQPTRPIFGKITLEDCISKHIDWMPLDERVCNFCERTSTNTRMKNTLSRLPDTLIILMKKFCMDDYGRASKNNVDVTYPVHDLDMTNF